MFFKYLTKLAMLTQPYTHTDKILTRTEIPQRHSELVYLNERGANYGRPWPAVYINFVLKIHQIQVLTEPLCRAQASFYVLPNKRGTKYRGLTYSARQNCP